MILFTDLDRTLLAHDYSIHPRVREGFRRAADSGLRVIFVTARSPASLRIIAEDLDSLDYCVCYNGAWIGSLRDGATLSQTRLPLGTALAVMEHARATGVEPVWYDGLAPQVLEITPAVLKQLHNVGEEPLLLNAGSLRDGPYKIMCVDRRQEPQLSRVAERWSGETEVAQSHQVLLEIGPRNISKGTAVQFLAKQLAMDPSACYAAGDSYNDIPMLRAVGFPMTVSNAVPEVKAIATYVAPSCDEGGLSDIIDRVISRM
jgi:Cof subfamily protein (haloacid dehalogenase superfamily)